MLLSIDIKWLEILLCYETSDMRAQDCAVAQSSGTDLAYDKNMIEPSALLCHQSTPLIVVSEL